MKLSFKKAKFPFMLPRILEYINTLEDEQQKETCHQLNRRTEFQVLRTTYKLYE